MNAEVERANFEAVTLKVDNITPRDDHHQNSPLPLTSVKKSQSDNFQDHSFEHDLKSATSKVKPIMVAKIAMVFLILTINFLYSRKFNTPRKSVECLRDNIFELTQGLNEQLNSNKGLLRIFQLTSSGLVDFADLSILYYYYKVGLDLRYPIQLILFYVTRGIVQNIFLFRYPEGGVWDYPGFPSLTVPYGLNNDFYYSGHCGFVTMMGFEMWRLGNLKLAIFIGLTALYLGFVLVASRIHYSIDIPIGILVGAYCHYLSNKYLRHFQAILRRIFNRCCWLKCKVFSEV